MLPDAAVVSLLADKFVFRDSERRHPSVSNRSVAVLPFDSVNRDPGSQRA
jgi:hypothetical protein